MFFSFFYLDILLVKRVMAHKANLTQHLVILLEGTAGLAVLVLVVVCQMALLPVAKMLLNQNFQWVIIDNTIQKKAFNAIIKSFLGTIKRKPSMKPSLPLTSITRQLKEVGETRDEMDCALPVASSPVSYTNTGI